MPPHFVSSGGAPWDTVRSLRGDRGATVRNVAEKIRRSSNGDPAIAVRWPHDDPRVIERRSADAYKGRFPRGHPWGAVRWSSDCNGWSRRDPPINTLDPSQHIKSRTLVEELTRLTDSKVAKQYIVRIIHIFPIKYATRKEAEAQERANTCNKERRGTDGQGWWRWWTVYKSRTWRQWRWRHRTPWTLKAVHKWAG